MVSVGDASIETLSLVKRHGATLAVDRVSLSVRRGEFFSILGPSGAGKTSVLRMLAGFETPDEGDVLIEGRSMAGVPPNHRPVNLVFQSYALFPHLTVAENVAFGLEMRRIPRHEIAPRVRAALDMVQLQGKRDRLPAQLSGGEQQRVALARALINRPAVVLLDEPLSALDHQLRREMQVELKTIQEQVGLTFVCVTHHQEEALTMSDRIAVMNGGRVLQVGRPGEIYETPASPFVARFIGLSNELTGIVRSDGGGSQWLDTDQLDLPIRVQTDRRWTGRERGLLILRPERLHVAGAPDPAFENRVPARVQQVLYAGSDIRYVVRLNDRVHWHVKALNSETAKPPAPGELLYVCWRASEGVLLPA